MSFLSTLTHQSRQLYSKLFPIPCLLCGQPAGDKALCQHCIQDLPLLGPACRRCAMPLASGEICGRCLRHPPRQDRSFSLLRYEGPTTRCITAFKYRQQIHLGRLFAELMATALSERNELPQCLIPVPLHPRRLRQRGYNQAAELARLLGNKLDIPNRHDLLLRTKNTPPLHPLSHRQRRSNLQQAFSSQASNVPVHVALIDDVMTSGATSAEAAKVLRARGAELIEVWTIARAISHY